MKVLIHTHLTLRLALFALLAGGTLSVPSAHGQEEPVMEILNPRSEWGSAEGGNGTWLSPVAFVDFPSTTTITVSPGDTIPMTLTFSEGHWPGDVPVFITGEPSFIWRYAFRRDGGALYEDYIPGSIDAPTYVEARLFTPGTYEFFTRGLGPPDFHRLRVIVEEPPSGTVAGEPTVTVNDTETYTLTPRNATNWVWVVTRDGTEVHRANTTTSRTLRYRFTTASDNYVIYAHLTGPGGSADSDRLTVEAVPPVPDPPEGRIDGPLMGVVGTPGTFEVVETEDADSWTWHLTGPIGPIADNHPDADSIIHDWPQGAGIYETKLVLTGDGGTADSENTVTTTVTPAGPSATIAGLPSVRVNTPATYALTPSNATSWVWTVSKDGSEIHRSPSGTALTWAYTFADPGDYEIGVELTGPGGTADVTIRIVVTSDPTGSVSGPSPVAVGSRHVYTLTSSHATSWVWTVSKDGAEIRRDSPTTDPTLTYTFDRGTGDYVIGAELFDDSDGSGDAEPKTVTARPPAPIGEVDGFNLVDADSTHDYTLVSNHADSWVWQVTLPDDTIDRPGGNGSTTLSYTFEAGGGNYSIGATLTGDGGTGTATPQAVYVRQIAPPPPPTGRVTGLDSVETGSTHTYTLKETTADSWVWEVTLPGGAIDRPGSDDSRWLDYTFGAAQGSYSVGAALSRSGVSGTATPQAVTARTPPPDGSVKGAASVEVDATETYTLAATDADSWVWVVTKAAAEVHRGNATTVSSLTYTFVDGPGDYEIGAELTGPGGTGTAMPQTVTVSDLPTGSVSGPSPVAVGSRHTYTLTPRNATSWAWIVSKDGSEIHRSLSGPVLTLAYRFANGAGDYEIGAELVGPGGSGTAEPKEVTASDPPFGRITGPATGVVGAAGAFRVTQAQGHTSYTWRQTGPGGYTATGHADVQSISNAWSQGAGAYTTQLRLVGPGGTATSNTVTTVVTNPPLLPATPSASDITHVWGSPAFTPAWRGGSGAGAYQWRIRSQTSWTGGAWTPPSVGAYAFQVRRLGSGNWPTSGHSRFYTITVTPAPVTFAADARRFAWDGNEHAPTITASPAGATHAVTGTTRATDAGSYTATATAGGNYAGSADIVWSIDPAPVSFALAPARFVYDGTRHEPTITASPAEATWEAGGQVHATDAGSYAATATATGNYVGTAGLPWEIEKAPVTFTWRNLENPYEARMKHLAIAARSPSVPLISRPYTRRYGPAVGAYRVSVEAGDRNHHGSSTAQARVTALAATFTAAPRRLVYDGTEQGPVITATPADAAFAVTGTATATDAGAYTVTATATGNHVGTADLSWEIEKAPVTFTWRNLENPYEARMKHLAIAARSPNMPLISRPYTRRYGPAVGAYQVSVEAGDRNHHGSSTAQARVTAREAIFAATPLQFVHDGTQQGPVITATPADAGFAVTGTATAADAGSYTVTVTATGNHVGTADFVWTIDPAPVDFTLDPATFVYDGTEHEPTITPSPADATWTPGGEVRATDAGTYVATATATGNHAGTVDLPWAIERAPVTFTLDPATFVYDGTVHEPVITPSVTDATWSAGGDVRATAAGTYVATATAGGNYTGTADLPWTIERAPVTFTASPLRFTYDGAEQGPAITPTPAEATFAVTGVERATDAGTYVAKATAGGNHAGVADLPWTIHPARPQPVTLAPGDGTVPVNSTVTFTATGGQGAHHWGGDLDLRQIAPGSRQALSFPDPGTFDVTVQTRAERNWLASNVATSTMTVLGGPLLSLEGDRDLGAVRVDQGTPQIVERDFTFLSSGSEPITITAITVHDSSAIAITSGQDVGDGVTLQPGETHAFTVRFDPDARGDEVAALRVVTAELGLRQQTLHGRGEQGLLEVRWGEARSTLTAAPNENLQTRHPPGHQTWFESAGLPGAPSPAPVSRYLDVRLRNAGNADLDLGAMEIAGDGADFAVASHANSLSPDEEIRATLTFTPSAGETGDRVADLTITADGTAASHSLLGYADDGGVVDPAISVGLVGPAASPARPNAEIFPSDDLTIQVHARANLGSLTRYRLRVHAPGAAQPGPWTVVESGPAAASVLASSHGHVAGATPGTWRVEAEALHRNGRSATAWMDFVVEPIYMPE